jgi:rhamnosyltransferase
MIAAIVVGYFPTRPILDRLLHSLLKQAEYVIFVDNGGGADFLSDDPTARAQVEYVDLAGNQGLGYALNVGFKLALARDCQYVATFDQDSNPPETLLAGLLQAHQTLKSQGVNCAAVGPAFYDNRAASQTLFPFYREIDGHIRTVTLDAQPRDAVEVDFLITSGMLINAAVWAEGLHYDAGLFVDYTDSDWCFRARAAGYRLYTSVDQEMGHALSDAPPLRVFGLNFYQYSPLRRYYYFRNSVLFIHQSYVSTAWKKRLTAGLLLRFVVSIISDPHKLASIKMMSRGIYHGFKRQDGAYH